MDQYSSDDELFERYMVERYMPERFSPDVNRGPGAGSRWTVSDNGCRNFEHRHFLIGSSLPLGEIGCWDGIRGARPWL
ncbi:hypothetical protein BS329_40210 [Amycolatopsis coloradensis]|uniref:Uncharacterized protein n=1 Tax=Amycolatopsis coloradensis TaxID=76021 RepID=A0A1R0KE13_9PSEU|nr:hypothetical protein [Amycolatopsis coloradensis]OLZ43164.1 hypothetical protein BS329_40210 [Amycolatopsis coloradensis]